MIGETLILESTRIIFFEVTSIIDDELGGLFELRHLARLQDMFLN
jgi:hypothetical protein